MVDPLEAVFYVRCVLPSLYNEEQLRLRESAKPVLTEDLCIVQKEEFSITCYMCEMCT
jgi:hypothetical protein